MQETAVAPPVPRPRIYTCSCGAAAGDVGELEEHILTCATGNLHHEPTRPQDRTARVEAALARAEEVRNDPVAREAARLGIDGDVLRDLVRKAVAEEVRIPPTETHRA